MAGEHRFNRIGGGVLIVWPDQVVALNRIGGGVLIVWPDQVVAIESFDANSCSIALANGLVYELDHSFEQVLDMLRAPDDRRREE